MLVIRRKREQRIRIGEDIEITVLEIDNGQVKLGIQAPRSVPVFREEIAATRHSNQDAALSALALQALELQALELQAPEPQTRESYPVPDSSSTPRVSISNSSA